MSFWDVTIEISCVENVSANWFYAFLLCGLKQPPVERHIC